MADWKLRVRKQQERIRTVSWQVGSSAHIGSRVEINDYANNLENIVEIAKETGAQVVFVMLANEEDLSQHQEETAWDPYRLVMKDTAARHGYSVAQHTRALQGVWTHQKQLFLDEMHPTALDTNLWGCPCIL